jgi:hypothetical protein
VIYLKWPLVLEFGLLSILPLNFYLHDISTNCNIAMSSGTNDTSLPYKNRVDGQIIGSRPTRCVCVVKGSRPASCMCVTYHAKKEKEKRSINCNSNHLHHLFKEHNYLNQSGLFSVYFWKNGVPEVVDRYMY